MIIAMLWCRWAYTLACRLRGLLILLASACLFRVFNHCSRRRLCFPYFDRLKHIEMHHFLPLGKYEVVLFEVFSQKLGRCRSMLHDNLAVLIVDWCLVQIPPPTTLFEKLEQKLRIVAPSNVAFVMMK